MPPLVAIVGRPNVGKSELFNRLIRKKHAITSPTAGTTRDTLYDVIEIYKGKKVEIVDTAGIVEQVENEGIIEGEMQDQARQTLAQCDFILFCVDGTVPLIRDDVILAQMVRESGKPTILVITKCDNEKQEQVDNEVYKLGIGEEIVFISSIHNRGIDNLKETLYEHMRRLKLFGRKKDEKKKETDIITFSILGRPNAGKSTLFNTLMKKKKAIVSDIPGTTRDTVDSMLEYEGQSFKIIDTAGLQRPGKAGRKTIEKFSRLRAMRAIKRSDVCILMLDATEKVSHMDKNISRYILEENKGIILVLNKWDLVKKKREEEQKEMEDEGKEIEEWERNESQMDRFLDYLQNQLEHLSWVPVLFISAETGKNVPNVIDQVQQVFEERQKRIETGKLNRFIDQVVAKHPPKGTKKIQPKIYYATQPEVNPPHFILFVNQDDAFHFSWRRYFENQLREKFGFEGTPVIIEYRNRKREDRTGR